jgi:cyclase
MLKKRIIPIQLLDGDRLVKSTNFHSKRDVGDPIKSSKVYSDQDADELILLSISRKSNSFEQLLKAVNKISENCFVPLSVGGGIKRIEDVRDLFRAGADKVILNSITFRAPELISKISEEFGRQAIVIGIDVRNERGTYVLYSECGRDRESVSLEKHIANVHKFGAGELFIQSIDCDGVMGGYDVALIREVIGKALMPIIAAGGAGNFNHLKEVFLECVDAAACGSLFNFGDNIHLRAKAYLKNYEIPLKSI